MRLFRRRSNFRDALILKYLVKVPLTECLPDLDLIQVLSNGGFLLLFLIKLDQMRDLK